MWAVKEFIQGGKNEIGLLNTIQGNSENSEGETVCQESGEGVVKGGR